MKVSAQSEAAHTAGIAPDQLPSQQVSQLLIIHCSTRVKHFIFL